MKKKVFVVSIILIVMCLGWALCLNDGHVLSYGRSKTLAQLIKGNQEKIHVYRNKHFNLNQLSCKKALVK